MTTDVSTLGSRFRATIQIAAAILALFVTSALLGAFITPHLPADIRTPVLGLGMWGSVLAGGLMLRLGRKTYKTIGLTRPNSWARCLVWVIGAYAIGLAGSIGLGELIRATTNWPPLDVGYIRQSIEGNLAAYAIWMVIVVWGSAAFGEELFARGFVMEKLQDVLGRQRLGVILAVVGQAVIFGLLHAIQGPTGIVITTWIGIVLGVVYFGSGRNLWAPILAHGLMDSVSLTMLFLGLPLPGYIQ